MGSPIQDTRDAKDRGQVRDTNEKGGRKSFYLIEGEGKNLSGDGKGGKKIHFATGYRLCTEKEEAPIRSTAAKKKNGRSSFFKSCRNKRERRGKNTPSASSLKTQKTQGSIVGLCWKKELV